MIIINIKNNNSNDVRTTTADMHIIRLVRGGGGGGGVSCSGSVVTRLSSGAAGLALRRVTGNELSAGELSHGRRRPRPIHGQTGRWCSASCATIALVANAPPNNNIIIIIHNTAARRRYIIVLLYTSAVRTHVAAARALNLNRYIMLKCVQGTCM